MSKEDELSYAESVMAILYKIGEKDYINIPSSEWGAFLMSLTSLLESDDVLLEGLMAQMNCKITNAKYWISKHGEERDDS